jgi:putative hydrolase of the HAD superfamily
MRAQMGFGHLFDRIFASADIGAMKHDQAFYTAVTATLRLPADTILFWDDSPTNVAAARTYGWRAEQYSDFDTFRTIMQRYLPYS